MTAMKLCANVQYDVYNEDLHMQDALSLWNVETGVREEVWTTMQENKNMISAETEIKIGIKPRTYNIDKAFHAVC